MEKRRMEFKPPIRSITRKKCRSTKHANELIRAPASKAMMKPVGKKRQHHGYSRHRALETKALASLMPTACNRLMYRVRLR